MSPKTTAVVISWNLRESVLRCIESLSAQKAVSRIVLVDNGSSDGTPDAVRERFGSVEVVELGRNTGFAAGANAGISKAVEHGADFALLVNSDVTAGSEAAARLVEAAERTGAGAVGAKLVRADNPSLLDGMYGRINWRNFASKVVGEGVHNCPICNKRTEVDYPLGAFLLLRVKALAKAGMFDESYFAYHEEMELCRRIRAAGYPIIYEPVEVFHEVGASVGAAGADLAREYLLARNSARFVGKYGRPLKKLKFWTFVLAASTLKLPVMIVTGRLAAHVANVRGWWDGLLDKPFDEVLMKKYNLL